MRMNSHLHRKCIRALEEVILCAFLSILRHGYSSSIPPDGQRIRMLGRLNAESFPYALVYFHNRNLQPDPMR
jgi:hypothetical protein